MALNIQNLKVPTSEEARENGRKGGIASGKARKEKATMKKTLEMLLDETNNRGTTYRELTTLGLIKGTVDGKSENYKIILQLLGELTEPKNTINFNWQPPADLIRITPEDEKEHEDNA